MAYNRFRTATPMADWRSFRVPFCTSTETVVVGTLYLVNDTWCMAFSGDYADGETIETDEHDEWVGIYNCEKLLVDKSTETGSAFLVGEKVYVDPATKLVHNANASGYVCIGICTEPADDDDERVEIDLKGDSMTDQP
jgi:predicted RecA/RadA family phage recombinase